MEDVISRNMIAFDQAKKVLLDSESDAGKRGKLCISEEQRFPPSIVYHQPDSCEFTRQPSIHNRVVGAKTWKLSLSTDTGKSKSAVRDKKESCEETALSKSVRRKMKQQHAALLFPDFFPRDGVFCSCREDYSEALRHDAVVDPILSSWMLLFGRKNTT